MFMDYKIYYPENIIFPQVRPKVKKTLTTEVPEKYFYDN